MTSLSLVKPNIPATPSRLSWLKDITIDVSFGEADFAAVTRCEKMLLVEFVNIQIKHQRIGLLSESEYTAAEKPVRDAEKGQFGWFSLAKYHDHHRNKSNCHKLLK